MESLPTSVQPLEEVPCPYRGLEPFEAEHAANYFGREAMVRDLVEKVKAQSFVAVVGPSGCGKSSLVRAGLVTALRREQAPGSQALDDPHLSPGRRSLVELAAPWRMSWSRMAAWSSAWRRRAGWQTICGTRQLRWPTSRLCCAARAQT